MSKNQQTIIDILEDSELDFKYLIVRGCVIVYVDVSKGDNSKNSLVSSLSTKSNKWHTRMEKIGLIRELNEIDPILKRIKAMSPFRLNNYHLMNKARIYDMEPDFSMVFCKVQDTLMSQ